MDNSSSFTSFPSPCPSSLRWSIAIRQVLITNRLEGTMGSVLASQSSFRSAEASASATKCQVLLDRQQEQHRRPALTISALSKQVTSLQTQVDSSTAVATAAIRKLSEQQQELRSDLRELISLMRSLPLTPPPPGQ